MTSEGAGHRSKLWAPEATIGILTIFVFSNFVTMTTSSYQETSNERISDYLPNELSKSRGFRIKKDSDDYSQVEKFLMFQRRRRQEVMRRHSSHHHSERRKSHHNKSKKSHHSSRHKQRELAELKKEKELMEDVARLQQENRFYYFNEQLPATRLPNAYDSLMNITNEDPWDEHPQRRRNAANNKNESLWKPLKVETKTSPFHFHVPILTGNSVADSNVDFNEILNEATKYKNPLDFFFIPPSDYDKPQNVTTPTISPRLHGTLKPLVKTLESKGLYNFHDQFLWLTTRMLVTFHIVGGTGN